MKFWNENNTVKSYVQRFAPPTTSVYLFSFSVLARREAHSQVKLIPCWRGQQQQPSGDTSRFESWTHSSILLCSFIASALRLAATCSPSARCPFGCEIYVCEARRGCCFPWSSFYYDFFFFPHFEHISKCLTVFASFISWLFLKYKILKLGKIARATGTIILCFVKFAKTLRGGAHFRDHKHSRQCLKLYLEADSM